MPWQQSDSLVRRVCRMESLLHTLKLTVFHLETEREMNPSHTGSGCCVILLTKTGKITKNIIYPTYTVVLCYSSNSYQDTAVQWK